MMIALELMKGFDKLGIPYRFNDFKYADEHPEELVCIIGKPHLIFNRKWKNPILMGAGVYSHPVECPDLFIRYPNIKKFLVPGEWMKKMCEPYYEEKVIAWPVGIDTEKWSPEIKNASLKNDFLIYDKVRWEHDIFQSTLINPITEELTKRGLSYDYIRYGSYHPSELIEKLSHCRAVIFLCEHETQGIAYQQILATNTPILAWDRGGYWQDPAYYPQIKYEPVTSVPYWDVRCGSKFKDINSFSTALDRFLEHLSDKKYIPRDYILENLTLELSALKYLKIYEQITSEL